MATLAGTIAQQTVTASVPLVLAGAGELIAQRAGVINVGIEGLMQVGCLAAFGGALAGGSGYAGLAAAVGAGALLAALFGAVVIFGRADQIVSGTALNILAAGLVTVAWQAMQAWAQRRVLAVGDAAFFSPALGGQYGMTYVAALLALGAALWLRCTRGGVIVRALGEAPDACAAAGVKVRLWRMGCVMLAGGCAGAAGSFLSIMWVPGFELGMVAGRGFLVLALVIFGRWSIGGMVLGCLFFGLINTLQINVKSQVFPWLPYQFFEMLPYVATLAALALMTRQSRGPAYLGKAWPER